MIPLKKLNRALTTVLLMMFTLVPCVGIAAEIMPSLALLPTANTHAMVNFWDRDPNSAFEVPLWHCVAPSADPLGTIPTPIREDSSFSIFAGWFDSPGGMSPNELGYYNLTYSGDIYYGTQFRPKYQEQPVPGDYCAVWADASASQAIVMNDDMLEFYLCDNFSDAVDKALETGGRLQLLAPVEAASLPVITVPEGQTLHLDMNGHPIRCDNAAPEEAFLENYGTLILENSAPQAALFQCGDKETAWMGCLVHNHPGAVIPLMRDITACTERAFVNDGTIEDLRDCQFYASEAAVNNGEIASISAHFSQTSQTVGAALLDNAGSLHIAGGSFSLGQSGTIVSGGGTVTFPHRQSLPAPTDGTYPPGCYTLLPLVSVSFYDEDETSLLSRYETLLIEGFAPQYEGEPPRKAEGFEEGVPCTYAFAGWRNQEGTLLTTEEISQLRVDTDLFAVYTPTFQPPVAQVGDSLYYSFPAAMEAALAGVQPAVIRLTDHVTIPEGAEPLQIPPAATVKLDLQTFSLSGSGPLITSQGNLTLQGGKLCAQDGACLDMTAGSVLIQDCQMTSTGDCAATISGGVLTLESGLLSARKRALTATRVCTVLVQGDARLSGAEAAIWVTGQDAAVVLSGGYYQGGFHGPVTYGETMALSSLSNEEGFYRVVSTQQPDLIPVLDDTTATASLPPDLTVEELSPLVLSTETGQETVTASQVTIPRQVAAQLGKAASLTLQTDVGEVHLDRAALTAIQDEAGRAGLSLSLAQVTHHLAAPTASVVVDVTLTDSDGTPLTFSEGTATVAVPFTPPAGRSPQDYWVYHLPENGGPVVVPSRYQDGRMAFTTSHFSFYAIDQAPRCDLTLVADGGHHNAGEIFTVDLFATATVDCTMESFGFTPYVDETLLELLAVTTPLSGFQVTKAKEYVISGGSTTVGAEPVPIATLQFRVREANGSAVIQLAAPRSAYLGNIPLPTNQGNEVEVPLHHIQITLQTDGNSVVNSGSSLTLYAKYQQPGLYESPYATPVTQVDIAAKEGYRLAVPPWRGGINSYHSFEEISQLSFTENATFNLQTVKICTISFSNGNNGSLSSLSPITVEQGTPLSTLTLPQPQPAPGFAFVGWLAENKPVSDSHMVTDHITLTPTFSRLTFSLHTDIANAYFTPLAGLTADATVTWGTDLVFQVAPDPKHAVYQVSYTVGSGHCTNLTPDPDNRYTIPGQVIQGDLAVTVRCLPYHTLTFVPTQGITMPTATAYVFQGKEGLYATADFTSPFTCPLPQAQDGYRLATDTAQDPLWLAHNGTQYTSSLLQTARFWEDITLTPRAIPFWQVTFQVDPCGDLLGDLTLTADQGTQLAPSQFPTPVSPPGYVFAGWSPAPETPITSPMVFTANFRPGTYPILFEHTQAATANILAGVSQDHVTYETDIRFTLSPLPDYRITEVTYAIDGGPANSLVPMDGIYTIPGGEITGPIQVTVNALETVTVTFVAGSNGTLSGPLTATVDKGSTLTPEQVPAAQGLPGHPFLAWWVDGEAVDWETYSIMAPVTFTAIFDVNSFPVSLSPGLTGPAATAFREKPFTFTPSVHNHIIIDLCYTVSGGDPMALFPNWDGSYTIPAEQVTGPIAIVATTIPGNLILIPGGQYGAAPKGQQLVLLASPWLSDRHFVLGDGNAFYWSPRQEAYLRFVGAEETAATLTAGLITAAGPATVLDGTGDLDGSWQVTAEDGALINKLLHGQPVALTEQLRLEMDADGNQSVTTGDLQWILEAAEGIIPGPVAVATGPGHSLTLSVNGETAPSVPLGEPVTVTLALNRADGDPVAFRAIQDRISFDPAYFQLVADSIQVFSDDGSGTGFQVSPQAVSHPGVTDSLFCNRAGFDEWHGSPGALLLSFQLKPLQTGTATLTHHDWELRQWADSPLAVTANSATVTITHPIHNGGGGGGSGGGGPLAPLPDPLPEVLPEPLPLPFADVAPMDWFYPAVRFVYEMGLMQGVTTDSFQPSLPMNRAMLVTVLHRLEGEPLAPTATFSDLFPEDWYAPAVNWAATTGLVKGYPDGTFSPLAPITREELALLLYRYAAWKGQAVPPGSLAGFPDREEVSPWAAGELSWAVDRGLVQGTDEGRLDPQGFATRAQVAAILMRYTQPSLATSPDETP